MKKRDWELTAEAFEKLLVWLDPDTARAGQKYEEIRRSLVAFFQCRNCLTPEDETDKVIDRVARRVSEGVDIYTSDPYHYFYGVAVRILREYQRKPAPTLPVPAADSAEEERRLACMESCLQALPAEARQMLADYYEPDRRLRKANRERILKHMGVSLNALRLRVFRLRDQLGECCRKCLNKGGS
jgi:hypothetical protein